MGFFSKVWKGVKKGFKTLFKPIKAVFKTVGKFMNKIGIVGQIAMMFIPIPGLGALMSSMGGALQTAAGTLGASSSIIAQGAGKLLSGALKVGTKIGQGFKTITEGVKTFVGNTGKYLANKIPGVNIAGAPTSFFGPGSESVLGKTSASISKNMDTLFGKIPAPKATMNVVPDATPVGPDQINAPAQSGVLDEATGKVDFGKQEFLQTPGAVDMPTSSVSPELQGLDIPTETSYQFDSTTGQRVPGSTKFGTTDTFAPAGPVDAPRSILGRVGDAIKGAPGKFGDYVTRPGDGLRADLFSKAQALPEKVFDQALMGTVNNKLFGEDAQKEYSQGYAPIQTDSYASAQLAGGMRSLDVYSQFGGFTDYMTPIMGTGASDKGLWAMNLQQRTG
jgi:hypothetical protein